MPKKGIDVSSWQGDIDFNRVKAAGVEFVILRSSMGLSTVDEKFVTNVEKCQNADLPIKAVYHFSYALNPEQAKQEAGFCVDQLSGLDVIVFFDFEYDTVEYAKKQGVTLGPVECNANARTFCDEVEARGYRAGIYYNLDYYKYWYDHDLLAKYISWLADYSGVAYESTFHQYSGTGTVDGIVGDVDMDHYYGSDITTEEDIMDFTTLTDEQVDALLARINKRLASLPVTDYAKESSEKGVKSGVFSDGDKDGLIDNPRGNMLRQELATVLNRAGILDQVIAIKK